MMFTASLILQLSDQGMIDLDTTAQSILSGYDYHEGGVAITLGQGMEYGSGLMRFKLPRWMNLFRETL